MPRGVGRNSPVPSAKKASSRLSMPGTRLSVRPTTRAATLTANVMVTLLKSALRRVRTSSIN